MCTYDTISFHTDHFRIQKGFRIKSVDFVNMFKNLPGTNCLQRLSADDKNSPLANENVNCSKETNAIHSYNTLSIFVLCYFSGQLTVVIL